MSSGAQIFIVITIIIVLFFFIFLGVFCSLTIQQNTTVYTPNGGILTYTPNGNKAVSISGTEYYVTPNAGSITGFYFTNAFNGYEFVTTANGNVFKETANGTIISITYVGPVSTPNGAVGYTETTPNGGSIITLGNGVFYTNGGNTYSVGSNAYDIAYSSIYGYTYDTSSVGGTFKSQTINGDVTNSVTSGGEANTKTINGSYVTTVPTPNGSQTTKYTPNGKVTITDETTTYSETTNGNLKVNNQKTTVGYNVKATISTTEGWIFTAGGGRLYTTPDSQNLYEVLVSGEIKIRTPNGAVTETSGVGFTVDGYLVQQTVNGTSIIEVPSPVGYVEFIVTPNGFYDTTPLGATDYFTTNGKFVDSVTPNGKVKT